jgi:hypothetical protein
MQMTAPDAQCGVVLVRGDFPGNPDAILARAQRRNQKGTFGMSIRIPPYQEWAQEPTASQGLISFRWPYTQLNWVRDSDLGGDPFATFTVYSFVEHGTLYQIVRIVPKTLSRPSPTTSTTNLPEKANTKTPVRYTINVGGLIRFGCLSTAATLRIHSMPLASSLTTTPPSLLMKLPPKYLPVPANTTRKDWKSAPRSIAVYKAFLATSVR